MKKKWGLNIIFLLLFLAAVFGCRFRGQALTTTVRVGFCNHMAPYQFSTDDGKPAGFHIDVLDALAQNNSLLIDYTAFETTVDAMDALRAGEIDIVLGTVKEHFPGYDFWQSDVLSTANLCLSGQNKEAERNQNTRIFPYPVAVEYRMIDYQYLTALNAYNILQCGSQERSIEALVKGRTDYLVAVKECLLYYLEAWGLLDHYEILNNYVASADYMIALRKGDYYLRDTVNKGLAELRTSGEYEKIYGNWFRLNQEVDYQRILRIALPAVGLFFILLMTYLAATMRARKQLAKQVAARTSELQEANEELERRMELEQAENRLRHSIIESAPAGMALIDDSLKVEYMNQNAVQLAEISDNPAGRPISELSFWGDFIRQVGEDLFSQNWTTRTGNIEQVNRAQPSKGLEKYRYNIQKISRFGGHQSALLTVEDITSEEREREAYFEKEKNKALNTLIAGIAHEIKNPLTAISASADMIQTKGDNAKFREAFSRYIPQEIERIKVLINSLIDYARPSRSRSEPVELPEVLRSVCELAKVTAKNDQISVRYIGPAKLTVTGDRDKFQQTFLNIVLNSLESVRHKFNQDHLPHTVLVEAASENGTVAAKVTDDGVGMTAEELARCTEPFYTTKPAGTGIGLAVSKQYIEEIGGTISITSEKNQYTCVEIRLPKAGAEQEVSCETGNTDH